MYIADKYWNNYIGDTDDSLTLASYLMYKRQGKISLAEIFSDLGLDKLNGNFRQNDEPITVKLRDNENDGYDVEFYYPIDIITDLAAILLECKKGGSVDVNELLGLKACSYQHYKYRERREYNKNCIGRFLYSSS